MLPIAKAGVLLVLIGAGVTATYAVTNGGFGNGASSGDNTHKTAGSTTASPKTEVSSGSSKPGEQNTNPTPENKQQNSVENASNGQSKEEKTDPTPKEGSENQPTGPAQNANQGTQSPTR